MIDCGWGLIIRASFKDIFDKINATLREAKSLQRYLPLSFLYWSLPTKDQYIFSFIWPPLCFRPFSEFFFLFYRNNTRMLKHGLSDIPYEILILIAKVQLLIRKPESCRMQKGLFCFCLIIFWGTLRDECQLPRWFRPLNTQQWSSMIPHWTLGRKKC